MSRHHADASRIHRDTGQGQMEEQSQLLGRKHHERSAGTKALLYCLVEGRAPPHHFWAETILALRCVEARHYRLQRRGGGPHRGRPTTKADLNPPAGLGCLVPRRDRLFVPPRRCACYRRLWIAEPKVEEEIHWQADQLRQQAFVRVDATQLIKPSRSPLFPSGVGCHGNLDDSVSRLGQRVGGRGQRIRVRLAQWVDVLTPQPEAGPGRAKARDATHDVRRGEAHS